MVKKLKAKNAADYIIPLDVNGLRGRLLFMPSKKKREILLIYGHHASLERMFGLAEDLNQYGKVTVPDLPGFGGMQSFYKIGLEPTIDNLADYLASLIKLRYRGKRLTIFGMSFGFAVVTRMLQKYPYLVNKVDLVFSVVGFVHYEDFKFKRLNFWLLKSWAKLFSGKYSASFMRYIILRPSIIRLSYRLVADRHSKLKDANKIEQARRINFEIILWHINDVRTYMKTTLEMLNLNLCNKLVKLRVYHIAVEPDRYFDNHIVEQHMRVIYNNFTKVKSKIKGHAPTVIADAKAAAPFIPNKIREILAK